jgi:hypothetical protein
MVRAIRFHELGGPEVPTPLDDGITANRYLDSPDRRPGKPVLRVRR